jgi:hypothetical protein
MIVFTGKSATDDTGSTGPVDFSGQAKGIYLIRVNTEKTCYFARMVLQ